eukprot:SAG31_NODE_2277_length_6027_cov_4.019062_11_plen_58_part_01
MYEAGSAGEAAAAGRAWDRTRAAAAAGRPSIATAAVRIPTKFSTVGICPRSLAPRALA